VHSQIVTLALLKNFRRQYLLQNCFLLLVIVQTESQNSHFDVTGFRLQSAHIFTLPLTLKVPHCTHALAFRRFASSATHSAEHLHPYLPSGWLANRSNVSEHTLQTTIFFFIDLP
jgi:hypothetical protein